MNHKPWQKELTRKPESLVPRTHIHLQDTPPNSSLTLPQTGKHSNTWTHEAGLMQTLRGIQVKDIEHRTFVILEYLPWTQKFPFAIYGPAKIWGTLILSGGLEHISVIQSPKIPPMHLRSSYVTPRSNCPSTGVNFSQVASKRHRTFSTTFLPPEDWCFEHYFYSW